MVSINPERVSRAQTPTKGRARQRDGRTSWGRVPHPAGGKSGIPKEKKRTATGASTNVGMERVRRVILFSQ
jgi:hypothetical protein